MTIKKIINRIFYDVKKFSIEEFEKIKRNYNLNETTNDRCYASYKFIWKTS